MSMVAERGRALEDAARREELAALVRELSPMVRRVLAQRLGRPDWHLVDDFEQDVWLSAWQWLLRGNEIRRPAGLLAKMARCRVVDHYRSARARRELATDPRADAALVRLCQEIEGAA